MKKSLLLMMASVCAILSYAQIGIGTTSPNSTLDVRGSLSLNYRAFTAGTTASATDNTLIFTGIADATVTLPDAATCMGRVYSIKNASITVPLPVLTIATTSAQTIDAGATWVLNDSKEMITVVSDGVNWKITGAGPVKTKTNVVIVQTAADFPEPVSGVINLAAGTTYEINGIIVLTNKINLNGCKLDGMNPNNDKLIYVTGSGELFTGSKGGVIENLSLVAGTTGAKLFNLDLEATQNIIMQDNIIAGCKDVGRVKGGNICFFNKINYAGNLSGITYESNTNLVLNNVGWFSTNSGTFEKLEGNFAVIAKQGGFYEPMLTLSGVAMDITGITGITEGAYFKNAAIFGTGTKVIGTFSNKWEVDVLGLNSERDAVAAGNLYITTIIPTTFSVVNIPTKILGTTTAASLYRVTSPSSNRLTYGGTKTRRFQILCSLTCSQASSNKEYSFYISKNGVVLPESRQKVKLINSSDQISVTISCEASLSPTDYVEVWVEANTSTTSVDVETFNLSIK